LAPLVGFNILSTFEEINLKMATAETFEDTIQVMEEVKAFYNAKEELDVIAKIMESHRFGDEAIARQNEQIKDVIKGAVQRNYD
jgi:hypothetical protein